MDNSGLDLHKRETQLCLLTEAGELIEQRIATTRARFTAVLGPRPRSRIGVARLRTAAGIGPVTAVAFVATLDAVERFASAHQVEA